MQSECPGLEQGVENLLAGKIAKKKPPPRKPPRGKITLSLIAKRTAEDHGGSSAHHSEERRVDGAAGALHGGVVDVEGGEGGGHVFLRTLENCYRANDLHRYLDANS
jgi:hypothetical protein